MNLHSAKRKLAQYACKGKAKILRSFFKTGPGEYGEGDVFIGVTVPRIRQIAQANSDLSLDKVCALLKSAIHEQRLLALLILIIQYRIGNAALKNRIYRNYLKHTKYINNWDLVDLSCHWIVGDFLANKSKQVLCRLARSKNIWERRISIISTYCYIRNNAFEPTLKISELLLEDKEDLIQKAVGWMLREVGKRNLSLEETFLKKYYTKMPRTMLRYAIERFPEVKRKRYLRGTVSIG
jgi:3-methyladenine DNA glycosylase AlkD